MPNPPFHQVYNLHGDTDFFYLTVDAQPYRLRWEICSPRLAQASLAQRLHIEVSPSGYGLHWPEIDEDLAINPLLQIATPVETHDLLNA